MNNYKELKIWQKAVELAVSVYKTKKEFPQEEQYGLTSQIRRSSISIPSNIAEGAGRNSHRDFNNFLSISYGSTCELDTQLLIANRVGFLKEPIFQQLSEQIEEIQKMNYALKKSLKTNYSRLITKDLIIIKT